MMMSTEAEKGKQVKNEMTKICIPQIWANSAKHTLFATTYHALIKS